MLLFIRYYTVTQAQQNADAVRRQIVHSLTVSWLGAFASTLPLLFGWSHIQLDPDSLLCAPDWTSDSMIDRAYPVFYAIIGLVVPFLIKAFCYYQVYTKVHSVARKVRYKRMSIFPLAVRVSNASKASQSSISNKSLNNTHRQSTVSTISTGSAISNVNQGIQRMQEGQEMQQQERKLARVMVLIVMFSFVSWGPYGISLICLSFTNNRVTPLMLIITSLIAKACVVYNPLIYVAFNRKFRESFFKALMCHYYHPIIMNTPPARSEPPAAATVGSRLVTPTHVPKNTGPHTRALHRYSNAKRFSVPMLSTINEMESKYITGSSYNSDEESPDTLQNQVQKRTAKCSLPESEIRKAQELMKAKNNREMMQYLKKSRPQSPQGKTSTHLLVPTCKKNSAIPKSPAVKPQEENAQPSQRKTSVHQGMKAPLPPSPQAGTWKFHPHNANNDVVTDRKLPQNQKTQETPLRRKVSVPQGPPPQHSALARKASMPLGPPRKTTLRKASVPQGPPLYGSSARKASMPQGPLPPSLPPPLTITVRGQCQQAPITSAQRMAMKRKQVVTNGHAPTNPGRRRQSLDSLVLGIIGQSDMLH